MKQRIKFEGSVTADMDLDLEINLKKKEFIKCIDGFVNEANKTSGRIYVPHDFVGYKVLILIEKK